MKTLRTYEDFPARLIAVSVLVTVAIYAAGAFILSGFGAVMTGLYLLFCLGNEIHVMKKSCVDCCYFGKWCAFGKGKAAAMLFEQGEPQRFPKKTISMKELAPDLLTVMLPLIGGIALLIHQFSWVTVIALTALLALATGGNFVIRSRIACAGCKQRELGCPAEQFFSRKAA